VRAGDAQGERLGDYLLLGKVAEGGMGEVFLARRQRPRRSGKLLILKTIATRLAQDARFVALFRSEALLAACMEHPNIVRVYEAGEAQGRPFIAMERVQGRSLREVIDAALARGQQLDAELCRGLLEQVCAAVAYAHELTCAAGRPLRVLHRDLNPRNVLVSYAGEVKLIDFGIATSDLSAAGAAAPAAEGKFAYMSPEQARGQPLDARADVFALGVTLYEMLTGQNPFRRGSRELTLDAVLHHHPPPPSAEGAAHASFDRIADRALAKDPRRRHPSAAALRDDLRRLKLPPPKQRLSNLMNRLFPSRREPA
jgi:serine/threonine protein kinase